MYKQIVVHPYQKTSLSNEHKSTPGTHILSIRKFKLQTQSKECRNSLIYYKIQSDSFMLAAYSFGALEGKFSDTELYLQSYLVFFF